MANREWIVIRNVVATATFKQSFNLDAIAKAFPLNAEYRPETFAGVSFRIKKPKTCTLIFRTGKMVCTGAKSARQAKKAILSVVTELKRGGIVIASGKPEIQVVNIVATVVLDGSIDLPAFYEFNRNMHGKIIYEPEQFPGLIYRMESPRVVFLIFSTGKLVCTGAKNEEDIFKAAEKIRRRLSEEGFLLTEEH